MKKAILVQSESAVLLEFLEKPAPRDRQVQKANKVCRVRED